MSSRLLLALALALVLAVPGAHAQTDAVPTVVVVRAVSQDGKLIQTPVGGARVVIREASTGRVLAEGLQAGDSGDTDLIMREPHRRGVDVYDTPGAAAFRDTLLLARPTEVEITVEGPLDYPQAQRRSSTTMLLVPGRHVLGDGVLLPIHGFIVEILDAAAEDSVRARVRLTCGCPTTPGGLWDSDGIDIAARWMDEGGAVLAEAPMRYAGESSTYEVHLPRPEGAAELQVLAADADAVNFGMARRDG